MRPMTARGISTPLYLFGLVTAVVLPLLAFAGILLTLYAAAERARYERDAVQIARQVALLVDGELKGLVALLQGLSTSSALAKDDLADFYTQAARLVEGRDEVVLLRDFGSRQLINTQRPFGSAIPAPVPIPAGDQAALAAGRSIVSAVYRSPILGDARVAVAIPILRDGRPPYVLAVTIPTARIRDVIVPAIPPGWVIGIADRDGAYVTRSLRHEEVTGKPGLPEYLEKAAGPSGTFTSTNFEGTVLLAGYHRSDFSNWLVGANIPQSILEIPLRRSLAALAAIGIIALGLSALLAYFFGKRVTDAAKGLSDRASALGEARLVTPLSSRLADFIKVGDALSRAAIAIADRAREREKAVEREALLAGVFDAAGLYVGIIEILKDDYRYLAANRGTAALFGRGDSGIDGMRGSELGLTPEDIRTRLELFRRCENQAVTLEYGFLRQGVATNWNLGTFVPLPPGPEGQRRLTYTSLDISDRKRSEEQRNLLVNELNHRVKNSLATVQSIAWQTFRGAISLREARDAFTRRLVALAKAHDVLTQESWRGADLSEVIAEAITAHGGRERFLVEGPSVQLAPALALTLALALHELVTNATKYGSLSVEGGMVSISWKIRGVDGKRSVLLKWVERNGPKVTPPAKQGFGSRLIAGFSDTIGGTARMDFAPEGVCCELELPIDSASDSSAQT